MSKTISALATAAAALSLAASSPAATHQGFSVTFPDNLCGFAGTSTVTGVDNVGELRSGISFDSGHVTQTFVADSGRGVTISFAGHEANAVPVTEPDGSVILVFTYSELQMKTQALGGSILEQNAGRVRVTFVIDPSGALASVRVEALAGQNPNLTGMPPCAEIATYLAGA